MRPMKHPVFGFLAIAFLVFLFCSEAKATLPQGSELPKEAGTTVVTLQETGGKPGGRFEYDVSFTALVDLEEVELFFTKPDEIVFDSEPQPFRGAMKAGETKTWKVKGTMKGMIRFEDGNVLHPPIRFEGAYLYPYDAVRQEIIRRFQTGEGIRYARNQEDAFREMESLQLKGKMIKVFKGWPA